jgi:hypothetical protein
VTETPILATDAYERTPRHRARRGDGLSGRWRGRPGPLPARQPHLFVPVAQRDPHVEPHARWSLACPRELTINGEPEDVVEIVASYSKWLSESEIPKLFVSAEPGTILPGAQRKLCRSWPNKRQVTVRGSYFVQEDSPREVGEAVAAFVTHI